MKRFLLAALLVIPSIAYSQAIAFDQKGPSGSLTESGTYVFNDAQYGHNRSLWGGSVVP